ncbi:PSD1 and planctomycete cytochrome C domain-containing protein [Verrucomicrobium sp. BvORR106]|uniref:PSD1 and planctomycete cytochrome C domain-containing protein n=1 Tax=Verrucomicrobium sp. BvORR106 TaxID=1403819 RepID=UPI00056DD09C|nr:PSD1 and planctomycete cytochrome C domain-containing protein [Verrucomicrobium sp. BvORR106]
MRFPPAQSLLAILSISGSALPAAPVDFVREVQPILAEHCTHCHGQDEATRKGGLRLDVREDALKGGKSDGPALVPGQPDTSALISRVLTHDSDEVMPPPKEKKPVSAAQVETLKRWITEGANYAKHWAFVPPVQAPVESGRDPVDALVQSHLAKLGVSPSPSAPAAILARRLYLDLTGLPPSPAEVTAFEAAAGQDRPSAVKALVAKLLATPQYGEKWARHWLDAARYSDSNGYEKDLPREQWAWRDWVIRAFNADMPYDRFLTEQLAGDLLPQPTQDQLVATGLLRNSMVNEEGAIVPEQFRMDEMFDRMDCLGKATLGISLQCAQCHSHKFDPISHEEYFGIFAYFNNAYEAQSWVYTPEEQKQVAQVKSTVRGVEEKLKRSRPEWQKEIAAWETGIKVGKPAWNPLKATELGSTSGLNHPTQEVDLSILTQGHPTTKGDIYAIFEPALKGATGLQLEALCHGDLPFNGPGRSKYGTWAISEMVVTTQAPGSEQWTPVKLTRATADFSEPDGRMEEDWKADFDKEQKRVRGPVSYLIDGNDDTGWRADRGPGLRNQEGVAVVQFEKPLDLPPGTKLKVLLKFYHSGSDNGRHNTQLGRCRVSLTEATNPEAPPVDHAATLAIATPVDQRTAAQQEAVFTAWRKTVKEAAPMNDQIAAAWKKLPPASTSILHLAERRGDSQRPTHLLDRGSWDRPKQLIPPHIPAALQLTRGTAAPTTSNDRLTFARWLTDPQAPLTARVAVNRVWQALFGSGLVETSEDFGMRAPVPEHQELLDWLAVDFMNHGWSHKHLISTILSSATYQQDSRVTAEARERDPNNRLLARGPRFRMEAEVLRDSALTMAGLLHQEVGGPSIFPPVPQSVLDYNYVRPTYWLPPDGPERYRRALYLFRKRSMPDPVMSSFDAPNGDLACARRPRSNTPLSSLTALNETIFVEAAQAMAQRVLREGGDNDATRAEYAIRLCTSRAIQPAERNQILSLAQTTRERLIKGELKAGQIAFSAFTKPELLPPNATPTDIAVWTVVSRVLLNLDETMTKS